jgi:hypothetical protein
MRNQLFIPVGLLVFLALPWPPAITAQSLQVNNSTCLQCHSNKQVGFAPAHAFAATNCVACHAGNNKSPLEDNAHDGLIAFPGDLANAERACGSCHADRVSAVKENLMHTGRGIVEVTRQVLGESVATDQTDSLQTLGNSVADSMLRKQCASCHIGQTKTEHRHDVMWDRGGGCLACHAGDYPDDAHPALTTRVSDARCFGCHARSGRISLSYTGLAEIDISAKVGKGENLRLPDGRHIERLSADAHYLAGMSCIDCHTSVGLMGSAGGIVHQRQAVDIGCTDCHEDPKPNLTTEKNGTPLPHVELRDNAAWLHTKNTDRVLKIPTAAPVHHEQDINHQRVTCVACHSQWAPQCFGCHMEYDADGEQWDHVDRELTPGRWNNERWHVDNALPALGVNEENQIELFVPGMIMTVAHPDLEEEKFVRMFAPLSPHTTGKSRSCKSCHRSSEALGLGRGKLTKNDGRTVFEPANDLLQDGLPADAWTNIGNSLGGRTPSSGQRPLNQAEMDAILNASIPDD